VTDHGAIDQYIAQCHGLVSNLRNMTEAAAAESADEFAAVQYEEETPAPKREIVFIDDEPAPAAPAEEPASTEKMQKLAVKPEWQTPATGSLIFGRELLRLFARHVEPSQATEMDTTVVLYPGINCMMRARDAAKVLGTELPMRRNLTTPGFPAGSLFCYELEGDFSGAGSLTLVCDLNDRVVVVQLTDEKPVPARLEQALYSSNWSVYDFVHGRLRTQADGQIAHRVRRRDNLIRVDTELASPEASNGSVRNTKTRVVLMMPAQLAGMILQLNAGLR
jgi:hypothetical protein